MLYSFANALHHQQVRKGTAIPYIAHLLSVSALVLEAGGDEDQSIAALLHDAVEDQGGTSTLKMIHRIFGERVAAIVKSCSDSTATDPATKMPWCERKMRYLAHLRKANEDVLLVAAADKLHNARAILSDYRVLGKKREQLWRRFNAPREQQLWYYGELVKSFRQTSLPKTLVNELDRVVRELEALANHRVMVRHVSSNRAKALRLGCE